MATKTVICTSAWWYRDTYYKAGSTLSVPVDTPVPGGFIVNGVATPKREVIPTRQLVEIEELKSENIRLQQELLDLKKQLSPKKETKKPAI
jgi:hypothetical protein